MPRPLPLLLLTGCALASTPPARADDAEDKAVAFVEKLRGRVERDDKQPGKPVVAVYLGLKNVTDAGVKELAALKNLTTLYLADNTEVTDAGAKELAGLKNLTRLMLSGTKVTDVGMKALAGWSSPRIVDSV